MNSQKEKFEASYVNQIAQINKELSMINFIESGRKDQKQNQQRKESLILEEKAKLEKLQKRPQLSKKNKIDQEQEELVRLSERAQKIRENAIMNHVVEFFADEE